MPRNQADKFLTASRKEVMISDQFILAAGTSFCWMCGNWETASTIEKV